MRAACRWVVLDWVCRLLGDIAAVVVVVEVGYQDRGRGLRLRQRKREREYLGVGSCWEEQNQLGSAGGL